MLALLRGKRKFLLLPIALSVVAIIYPFETTIAPEWKIRVVDARGAPVGGELVKEHWRHYSLDVDGASGAETQQSDKDGFVTFGRRAVRANLLQRGVGPLLNALRLREHASFGPRANVMVWGGSTVPNIAYYRPGEPLETQIALPSGNY
jgi:hypothetical protein